MTSKGYRPDIDGLRTLAVLPVVLFHAGFSTLSGGYVGVDIFFVISGFLITGILVNDAEKGRFSILNFYDRRIRRIFPALITVIVATLAAALFVLLPTEMTGLAQSAIAAVLFASNLLFWSTTNYFSGAPYETPLLHTWSLAVEEQFYIAWPIVVWLFTRPALRRFLVPLTVAGFVVSFVMAEILVVKSTKTAFYMFPPRAWELFVGALLALSPRLTIPGRTMRQAASTLGLILITVPVFLYTEASRFPGALALPPVLGTALLIAANAEGDTWVARLLSTRPFVGIGLISYSLYLWHWPIISLTRLATDRPATLLESTAMVLASVVLAYLSWRYVEAPFRKKGPAATAATRDQRRVIAGGFASMVLVAGLSGALIASKGLPQRLPAEASTIDSYALVPRYKPALGCMFTGEVPADVGKACMEDRREAQRATALLWGDSHAHAVAPGMVDAAKASGETLLVMVKMSCPPLTGATPVAISKANSTDCVRFNDAALETAINTPSIRTVIVASYWGKLANLSDTSEDPAAIDRFVVDPEHQGRSIENNIAVIQASLARTATALAKAGKTLVLMEQVPEFHASALKCLARARWRGADESRCGITTAALMGERNAFLTMLAGIAAAHPNVRLFDPLPVLCAGAQCGVSQGALPLYRDAHHLSEPGSRILGDHFWQGLRPAVTASAGEEAGAS